MYKLHVELIYDNNLLFGYLFILFAWENLKTGDLFLRLVKVFKNVEVEVAELAMVTMEAFGKGIAVDRLCRTASEKMSLMVCFRYNDA